MARQLVWEGHDVVLVGRRAEAVKAMAEGLTLLRPGASVCSHVADLSVMADVVRVGREIARDHPRLGGVLQNAGAFYSRWATTDEGIERTFALNVLAPYLLTELLIGPLRQGAPSRVLLVGSEAHRGHRLQLDRLERWPRYRGFRAYGRSKLALLMLGQRLADRYRADGITVNTVHPGFVRSGFGQNNPGATPWLIRQLARVAAISPARSATRVVPLLVDPAFAGRSGSYFVRLRPATPTRYAREEAASSALEAAVVARLRPWWTPSPSAP